MAFRAHFLALPAAGVLRGGYGAEVYFEVMCSWWTRNRGHEWSTTPRSRWRTQPRNGSETTSGSVLPARPFATRRTTFSSPPLRSTAAGCHAKPSTRSPSAAATPRGSRAAPGPRTSRARGSAAPCPEPDRFAPGAHAPAGNSNRSLSPSERATLHSLRPSMNTVLVASKTQ